MSIGFFFMDSLPSHPPGQIIPFPRSIQIIRCHDPDLLAALNHDSGQQPDGIGFAVVYVPRFLLCALLIDRDRAVRQTLFHVFGLDPMRPDLAQIGLVPREQRSVLKPVRNQLRRSRKKSPSTRSASVHDAIQGAVSAFTEGAGQSDDITLLVLEYRGGRLRVCARFGGTIELMRGCLIVLAAALCAFAASSDKTGTLSGKLVLNAEKPPAIATAGNKLVQLDGDGSTRKILGDQRLNGLEVQAKGHFTAPGRFLIDPIHTTALAVRKDGHLKMITVIPADGPSLGMAPSGT